jgi:transposase-like protein
MVRRLLDQLGLRVRVPRCTSAGARLEAGERWLRELAEQLGVSPHTLHGWRKKGWLHARQVGGRGGPWAVWVNEAERDRLRQLQACPRLWTNQERLAELRSPTLRQ